MKQRMTYILPPGSNLQAGDLAVKPDSLTFSKSQNAVEEWKFTLGLEELPDELREVLKDTYELHIRYSAPHRNARSLPPLVSRLPGGLHVFFTPRDESKELPLCRLVNGLVGSEKKGECVSVEESFSRPNVLSERFAGMASWQYFASGSDATGERMADSVLGKLCPARGGDAVAEDGCRVQFGRAQEAMYVDLDFDAIGQAVTITGAWSPFSSRERPGGEVETANKVVRKARESDRVEVGALQVEESEDAEELALGGFLTVLGEDEKPGTVMFSFPSRHHPLPASARTSYTATFQQPTGLHPKLDISLPSRNLNPPRDSCALHAYWTLPSALFIDRYQFSDPLFLDSQNLTALRSLSGEEDLEAPDWILKRWGSAALFELAHPNATDSASAREDTWTVTIPTHLRYLAGPQLPNDPPDQATLHIPWPTLFWACEAESGLKMSNNPFDRTNLGYDGLFGPKTMFYHIPPSSRAENLVAKVEVPVLRGEHEELVRLGTMIAVVVGFAWVVWKMSVGVGARERKVESKKVR